MATLSVIMPAYNAGNYIVNTIESILKQDYEDFIIVIVDDASTDNTTKLIKEKYCAEILSGKIVLIEQKHNVGPATARQLALDRVNTPYVTFMDADDSYCSYNAFSMMIESAKRTNADMIIWKYIVNHGNVCLRKNYHAPNNLMEVKEAFIERVRSGNPIWHYLWNKLYKTSIIKENGITFLKGLKAAEDVRFNEDIFPHLTHVYFLNQYLYIYNCTNVSSLTSSSKKESIPVNREDVVQAWNQECIHYDRITKTICIPLNCLETCEPILRFELCYAFIHHLKRIRSKTLRKSIKKELINTIHGQLILPIYATAHRKYHINSFKAKIRLFIKRIIKH